VIEPVRLAFEVACSPEDAFATWTADINSWWPRDHTVSGEESTVIRFEPGPGGRIFERTVAGREMEWGEVVAWEPPSRLAYLWHLGSDRKQATDVEVTFTPTVAGRTVVELVHTGWERLGDAGPQRRDRNQTGWTDVIEAYRKEGSNHGRR
jgi:uncharacterized protein YndB with AHSA1/START domain